MRLAFFDIDGTLVPGLSTELRFWLHLTRRGHQGWEQLRAWTRGAWRLEGRSFDSNKAYLSGLAPQALATIAEEWVPARLVPALFGPCTARLHWHQSRGDEVVLLSGTLDFLARPLGWALGTRRVLATRCAVVDGHFADPPPPLEHPVGPRKLALASALCETLGCRLDDAYAYANSRRDEPLLAAVGTAVAVRPDLYLARVARERGWEVLPSRSALRSQAAVAGD